MNPTDEQIDILNHATTTRDNLMINALAGCGKTHTLEAVVDAVEKQPMLYLVFNKKNADEATEKMASHTNGDMVTVRTFNSYGHRVWSQTQSARLRIDPQKTKNIFLEIAKAAPQDHRDAVWSVYSEVMQGVAMAKALGYIPEGQYSSARRLLSQSQFHSALDEVPDDLASDLIDAILLRSIKLSYEGLLDFNDQVYMPALFGGVFPKYPLTLVDEYQDLSPVNHMLLERSIKGRLIGVGDPWQNIYGFRGARARGMAEATRHYSAVELPLSVSFRCPSAIVRHVHWRVPHFKWLSEGGSVARPTRLSHRDFVEGATILCRNNAPLLRLGMQLLSAGRSITIAGSDIGPRLIGIMRKFGPEDLSREGVFGAIDEWEQAKLAKESSSAPDMAACMRVFAEQGRDLGQALAYADHLFKQQGQLYLSTIHKAKGLEWSTVYHLDPWILRKNPTDQDKNLDYVCSTRSRDSLIEIESESITWD